MNKNNMGNPIAPKTYGLSARTIVEEIDQHTIALVLRRKSRIIMSDGRKLVEKISQIKTYEPDKLFVLKTGAPVCSKTKTYLEQEGIKILRVAI